MLYFVNDQDLVNINQQKKACIVIGYHYNGGDHSKIWKITKSPNKHGVYEAIYIFNDIKKTSTFFPDTWSKQKVKSKINEAYKSPIKVMENGFIGITKEGIPLEFWFVQNRKTGEILINAVYPLM